MDLKEIKQIVLSKGKKDIKVGSVNNLYVRIRKNKPSNENKTGLTYTYYYKVKREGKKIEVAIGKVDNVTLKQAEKTATTINYNIGDLKGFEEAREKIRQLIKSRESSLDKQIKIKRKKEDEEWLFDTLLPEFILFMKNKNRTEKDINRVKNYFMPLLKGINVKKVTNKEVVNFYKSLKNVNKDNKNATRSKNMRDTADKLKALFSLFYNQFLFDKTGEVFNNPFHLTQKQLDTLLGEKEVENIDAITDAVDFIKLMLSLKQYKLNRTFQNFLIFQALTAQRFKSLASIKVSDVNLTDELIILRKENNKTKKKFLLPLTKNTIKIVKEQIKNKKDSDYLFQRNGKKLWADSVNKYLKRACWMAEVPEVSNHGFRSSFLTLIKQYKKVNDIEKTIIADMQLQHKIKVSNNFEDYQRGDYLEERRKLLRKWEEFIWVDYEYENSLFADVVSEDEHDEMFLKSKIEWVREMIKK